MPRRSIAETFSDLRAKHYLALMPFISAGYPDLATTAACLTEIEQAGASLIEVGFPFSDPIADGPTIQESYTRALQKKVKLSEIFSTIAAARPKIGIPLVGMVSHSIVYRVGVDRFVADAKTAGFDGLIIPDLPPPEAQSVCDKVRGALPAPVIHTPLSGLASRL